MSPLMADEIAGEIINQGYVTTLKRLGYKDAPVNAAFRGISPKSTGFVLSRRLPTPGKGGCIHGDAASAMWAELRDDRGYGMRAARK